MILTPSIPTENFDKFDIIDFSTYFSILYSPHEMAFVCIWTFL